MSRKRLTFVQRCCVPAVCASVALSLILIDASPVHASTYSFQGFGNDLNAAREPFGVSADGTIVVVNAGSGNPEAFRWTRGGGMIGLGELPGGFVASSGFGVSPDGATVVGRSLSASGLEAFRWTSTGGMVGLGDLPGGIFASEAWDASANGTVIVGWSASTSGDEAFRWTSASGMVGLGDLPGGAFYSRARDVSDDGEVVVGFSTYGVIGGQAFRWTSGGGMVGLGFLPGGLSPTKNSGAFGISGNGEVIVGDSSSEGGQQAFRWTIRDGMVGLGDLPGGGFQFNSYATDVSGDGEVIVGSGRSDAGDEAMLWTNEIGMVSLRDYLVEMGVSNLSNWFLREARGISADGRTIVGVGTNPSGDYEAWIVTIPEPSSLVLALGGLLSLALIARQRRTVRDPH